MSKHHGDNAATDESRPWPHAPPHRLTEAGVYFITSRTVDRQLFFNTPSRLDLLRDALLRLAAQYGWQLEAWAVLSNHYHFVAHSPSGSAGNLVKLIRHLHGETARTVNALDHQPGRKVWQNYRETRLTYPESYLARLAYTHQNAVHHRLVGRSSDYPWCSAREFEDACTKAWSETVYSFQFDDIALADGDED